MVGRAEGPLGPLVAGVDDGGVWFLEFGGGGRSDAHLEALGRRLDRPLVRRRHPLLDRLRGELEEYFDGRRRVFEVPVRLEGTPFQLRVWHELTKIPYGEVRSYLQIARGLGDPQAVRAVGGANGSNPISIVVPCHRVIGADGSIVGYGGGLERKRWLLAHERGERPLF
ncbi:MAG TPA: methylated-DNA--[protein]-cysteine S-methyltransferase [Candidatus Polarisedimenticolia bacterium]|nr:methylated-DNA--[protein]-cysteine S-methyltransferase [Candidatus Polarisedimenticolia bacterium]